MFVGSMRCYALIPKERAERYLADHQVKSLIDGLLERELALLEAQMDGEDDAIRRACEQEATLQIRQARVREATGIYNLKASETSRLLEKAEEIRLRKSSSAESGATRGFIGLGSAAANRTTAAATAATIEGAAAADGVAAADGGPESIQMAQAVAEVLLGHKELHEAIHELNRHRHKQTAGEQLSRVTGDWLGVMGSSPSNGGHVNPKEASYYSTKYYGSLLGESNIHPHQPLAATTRWGANNPYVSPPSDASDNDDRSRSVDAAVEPSWFRRDSSHLQSSAVGADDAHASLSMVSRSEARKALTETDPQLFRCILEAADAYRNSELRFDEATQLAKELHTMCELRSDELDLEVSKLSARRLIIESAPHVLGARTLELYDILSQLAVVDELSSGECGTLLRLCQTNCVELLPTPKETWESTRHWYN